MLIELSEEEAKQFKEYQEHHTQIRVLIDRGVFDITSGSATIHFDSDGIIRKIEGNHILFYKA